MRRRSWSLVAVALGAAAVLGGDETAAQDGGFQIRVVAADGTGGHSIGGVSFAFEPAWSPDGGRIAFIDSGADDIVGPQSRIRQSLPPGGSRTVLAAPTWSPDATKLTYLRPRRNGAALYVIDADGRNNRWLSSRPSTFSGVPATWAPDASQIAYGVGRFPG